MSQRGSFGLGDGLQRRNEWLRPDGMIEFKQRSGETVNDAVARTMRSRPKHEGVIELTEVNGVWQANETEAI